MITRLVAPATLVAALILATGCETGTEPVAVQPADKNAGNSNGKAGKPVTVKLAAKKTTAKKSVLGEAGALSCVKVTVTNQRKKNLAVNPLYFSITDTKGQKHESSEALAAYEGEMASTTLAPGEKATGVICGKGKFVPKIVAMTDELLQEQARAEVA
ncbi:hypothetical protein GCM10009678_07470 [Actinomadura kijaniata]|uniref:DUF4352 domain-containing protein n=1 Tax=Actinomadura namibiensis TaxID=182080 RepID=A0A7W3LLE3_ACTNM|nr:MULTISPECIES: DUF4352 domain-containing protein [Actinomadura]MBA8950286.1 hypothetical protein [Actinomadura namibiensis]